MDAQICKLQSRGSVNVQFYVNCSTQFGEYVYICGNCPQFGNWSPPAGVKLKTNKKKYPQWFTKNPVRFNPNTFVQFKICILKDSKVVWQSIPQNHLLFIDYDPIQVNAVFNSTYLQVNKKKVIQIQCNRNIQNLFSDVRSDWGSSVHYPQNYPLYQNHKNQPNQEINRSQISSNLMSGQNQVQMKIFNYLNKTNLLNQLQLSSKTQSKKNIERVNRTSSIKIICQNSQESLRQISNSRLSQSSRKKISLINENEKSYSRLLSLKSSQSDTTRQTTLTLNSSRLIISDFQDVKTPEIIGLKHQLEQEEISALNKLEEDFLLQFYN